MTADQGVWVENESFGTVYASTGGGGSDLRSDGTGFWYHFTFDFDALPENARLNDGNTDMTIRIRRVVLDDNSEGATTETPTVEGTWNYTFRLPESEASAAKNSDQTLEFANDLALTLHDIQVDEAQVTFTVETDNEEYFFVGSGEQAELARAAQPGAPCFTVEAVLSDGSVIPTTAVDMVLDEATDSDWWRIEWAAPIDPEEITALIFSDGTEEIEVAIH